jgi:hypothetical protein
MIEITSLNSSANLVYFEEYLKGNYSFKNFIVGVDSLHIEFETEPNESEKTDIINFYNNITESDWLEIYKQERFEQIDSKTTELIGQGYTYSGKQFSLSEDAQTNILALFTTKDDPILTYPIRFNTLDNLGFYDAIDSTTISNMYYTALATKKAHLDTGTALKDQIRNAVTKNDIDSINDNR